MACLACSAIYPSVKVWVAQFQRCQLKRYLPFLECNATRLHASCSCFLRGRKIHLNNPTVMSLFKIHYPVTQDNPETVMWGVSRENYFLSTELHCSKSTAATEDERPMLVKTWRTKGPWGRAYHTLWGFFSYGTLKWTYALFHYKSVDINRIVNRIKHSTRKNCIKPFILKPKLFRW